MRPSIPLALAPLVLAAAVGCHQLDGPDLSLLGTWTVLEFVDHGTPSDVEGVAVFTAEGKYSFDIRFRFPGEPPLGAAVDGTYELVGNRVTLHGSGSNGVTVAYDLLASGDRIIMVDARGPSVPTRITLRRIAR